MAVKRQEGESVGKLADPHAPLLWVRVFLVWLGIFLLRAALR